MRHNKKATFTLTTPKKNRLLALVFAGLMIVIQPSFVYAEL